MTFPDHIPCPEPNISDIPDLLNKQPVTTAIQLRQSGLPNRMNAFLTTQLSVVVECRVQGDMGIRHIVSEIGSRAKNAFAVLAVKSLHQFSMGPLQLPRDHTVFPEGVFSTSAQCP